MLLLGGIGGLVELVVSLMMWYAYDTAYTVTADSSNSAGDLTSAASVMSSIKEEMMWMSLDGIMTDLGLASVAEEWFMWNAWKADGGEEKKEKMDGEKRPRPEGDRPERELMAQIINFVNF